MKNIFKINIVKILGESTVMGIITYLISIMAFNLTFKNYKEDKPFGINLVFFITGVLLNIFIEIFNISKNNC
tara:strand:+ start:691 stop:906 length:216 start_codon:yes stop_codon:yes gene_type:complete